MDDITKLILAKYQVENIIELIKDNEYRQYMFMHLNPVYYVVSFLTYQKTADPPTTGATDYAILSNYKSDHSIWSRPA